MANMGRHSLTRMILQGIFLLSAISLSPGALEARASFQSLASLATMPDMHTPEEQIETWLRFHKDNLCQDVDAAFIFQGGKTRVLVNVQGSQNTKGLIKLLEPLKSSCPIDPVPVRIATQQDPPYLLSAPPSFWTNSKLNEYFVNSAALAAQISQKKSLSPPSVRMPSLYDIQWQVLQFSADYFNNARTMKNLAMHLPHLTRMAFDPQRHPNIRKLALKACRNHARELEKHIVGLKNSLSIALPEASLKLERVANRIPSNATGISPIEYADLLSFDTQKASDLAYDFMYPRTHTVDLGELRNPHLLQSLEDLLQIAREYRNAVD
jgi:hypothetical protein